MHEDRPSSSPATPAPSASSSSPAWAARPHRHHHQRQSHHYQGADRPVRRRIPIEQRLAEIIQGFCADALSSAVNLNVDLNVVLCVLAQALTAALRMRLPGNYGNATPTPSSGASSKPPGEIISDPAGITIKINRRAYSLVLRHTDLPRPPPSPGGTDAASTSSSPNPWAEVLVRKSVDLGSGAARASLCKGKEVLRGRAGSRSRGRRPDQASCFLLTRFWAIEVFSPSPGMITHAAR